MSTARPFASQPAYAGAGTRASGWGVEPFVDQPLVIALLVVLVVLPDRPAAA